MKKQDALISVFDHGFLYGDGIYETLRVYDGVVFMFDEHLRRLERSADMIGLKIPCNCDCLKSNVYDTLKANNLIDAYVRITVSRGNGELGLDPDLCPHPTLVIFTLPIKDYPKAYYEHGIKVIIPQQVRRNHRLALNPQIKSLNFLNNILAKIEAKRLDAYEAVLLNTDGYLTEGTISNIFFAKNGVLHTPSIECGILDGITRDIVIKIARKDGIEIKEGFYEKDFIYSADEVMLTNTTMEVMPVSRVDGIEFKTGRIAARLHNAYKEDVRAYVSEGKSRGPSIWADEQ